MGPCCVFTHQTKTQHVYKHRWLRNSPNLQHLPASMLCTANDGTKGLTLESCIKHLPADQRLLVAGLQRCGTICVVDRDVHIVSVVTEDEGTLYFVVTIPANRLAHNACRDWTVALKTVTCPDFRKLYQVASVASVRPFTRFSQRRLGWGDAEATKAKVAEAIADEDIQELVAMMPAARSLVQQNKLQDIPTLFEAFTSAQQPLGTGPMALTCQTERPAPDLVAVQPSSSALTTDALVCHVPSHAMQSLHEITGHAWKPRKDECDLCDQGPCDCGGKYGAACKAKVQTWQCECGVVRCGACRHVHAWTPARQAEACTLAACGQPYCRCCSCGAARCSDCFNIEGGSLIESWTCTHPAHKPATCYDTELQKVCDADKLAHMCLELGHDADLITCAEKYRQLFGATVNKAKCLGLCRMYKDLAKTAARGQYPSVAEARNKAYAME